MPTYKYEVVQENGKKKTGTMDAPSVEAASQELKAGGNFVVSISQASALNKDIDIHIGAIVKPRELSVFCRQMQSILNAGVTVIDALTMLAEQTENKEFKKAIIDVRDSVQKGETLSEAMARHPKIYPNIMVYMVEAGEASGSLDVAFDRLASQFEKDSHLRGLIVKSMIYPIILVLVIIVVDIILMVKIVPTFTETFDSLDAELPGITLAVMAVSDFLVKRWFVLLGIIVVLALVINEFKKTEAGAKFFGKLGLKLPLFGNLTIKSASARLCSTMSTLMAAGISTVDAVGIVEKLMTNAIVKQAMKEAQKEVEIGIPLSQPIAESQVFPPMVHHMIKIGEETGNMEEMLDKISEYYSEEVEMATQSLMAALEPLIIILMALVVVPIILAVMLPMYSMYDSI